MFMGLGVLIVLNDRFRTNPKVGPFSGFVLGNGGHFWILRTLQKIFMFVGTPHVHFYLLSLFIIKIKFEHLFCEITLEIPP